MPRSAAKPADVQGKQRILARLKSAVGHVRGVAEMVERDAYCIDVMRQTKAVQAALDRVNALLLDRHLRHCVSRAVRSQDAAERERVIGELITVLGAGGRR
jgi:DNA-binding FrmR family transcriptional regulator